MKTFHTCLGMLLASSASMTSFAQVDLSNLEARIEQLEKELSAQKETKKKEQELLTIGGRLQLDYNRFDGAYNAINDGEYGSDIFPRRVRLSAEGERDDLDFTLIMDFSEGDAEILLMRFRYNGFENGPKIKFGRIREDISLDALTSSKDLALIERSAYANTLSPYFRYGVSAYQNFDSGLRYAVGVYKNDAFGSDGKDETSDLSLAISSRLTWSNVYGDGHVLHLGGWHSLRQMDGDILGSSFARGEVRETEVRLLNYSAGGETVAVDQINQYGVEFGWQRDALLIQAEYGEREIETLDSSSPLDGETYEGYYVQASYFLTGESRRFSKGSAKWGSPKGVSKAWEVAARFTSFDASSDTQGTELGTFSLGASYYLNSDVRFMLNYVHSEVSGPGASALVGSEDEGDAITARIHYEF
ncbi:OprO/OprP family phosphate-selective porin [Sessilibacter sp. MAH4]